jgi:hypothetical protein
MDYIIIAAIIIMFSLRAESIFTIETPSRTFMHIKRRKPQRRHENVDHNKNEYEAHQQPSVE